MFEGFTDVRVQVGEVTLRVRHGGSEPAVLLVHGHPQTGATWVAGHDRCDARFATAWFHWFFYAQPDRPERAINADPDAWYGGDEATMGGDSYAEFRRAIHNPDTVRAMLEDYRAGLGIDYEHAVADRAAGRTVGCPTLLLWSTRDDLPELYGDPLQVWAPWAPNLTGQPIESGHHLAEGNPEALAALLGAFFSG